MLSTLRIIALRVVTPFVGVWIEINCTITKEMDEEESLPSWECGLKLYNTRYTCILTLVTPFVGVWIEMITRISAETGLTVTPFVGVWIEILSICSCNQLALVTPFVGVWIEIYTTCSKQEALKRHSLRGSVD